MPERLSPFEALAGDVRPLGRADAESVFPALRRGRQAKARKGAPLYYLHTASAECVSALLEQPPPGGLQAAHLPSIALSLFARPPLSAERGDLHSRLGIFLDAEADTAFVVHLRAVAAPPSPGAPAAFVSASLDAESLDLSDHVGLELGCLFVEAALADVELPSGSDSEVWAWQDVDDDDRRRVQVLSRLAGREAVFRADLAVGRGGIATLPATAKRVFVVRGTDDPSVQRWRRASVPVVDVATDDCLETVRAELCDAVFTRLQQAMAKAATRVEPSTAAGAGEAAAVTGPTRAAPWGWTTHARGRANERKIPVGLVDEHVVEPARDTRPKEVNRDPEGPAQGRTVIVGQCPPTDVMPDGGKLYRGVIPGPEGQRVVILGVGWKPQADGSRSIHTLYDPAAHPDSWNADYTRGTPAGEAAGDFPRGTRWFLTQ